MVILPLFALSGWRWFPGRRKGKCMKKQYRVILAAALVLSLAGCHTQESRIDPEGSAGQGTGTARRRRTRERIRGLTWGMGTKRTMGLFIRWEKWGMIISCRMH